MNNLLQFAHLNRVCVFTYLLNAVVTKLYSFLIRVFVKYFIFVYNKLLISNKLRFYILLCYVYKFICYDIMFLYLKWEVFDFKILRYIKVYYRRYINLQGYVYYRDHIHPTARVFLLVKLYSFANKNKIKTSDQWSNNHQAIFFC